MKKLVEKETILKTRIITSADGQRTYELSKIIEGESGGKGIFLLLYPTRTVDNLHVEDSTNIHLLNHMKEMGLSEYVVVNLFSMVTRSRLSVRGIKLDEENMEYIREKVFKAIDISRDKVVIAWGNSHQTSKMVNLAKLEVLKMWTELYKDEKLYQLSVDGFGEENAGVHPLYLGIRFSNAKWGLSVYPHGTVMKELIAEGQKVSEKQKDTKVRKQVEARKGKAEKPEG